MTYASTLNRIDNQKRRSLPIQIMRWKTPIPGFDPLPAHAEQLGSDLWPSGNLDHINSVRIICPEDVAGVAVRETRQDMSQRDRPGRYRVFMREVQIVRKFAPILTAQGFFAPPTDPESCEKIFGAWEDLGEFTGPEFHAERETEAYMVDFVVVPVAIDEWATVPGWYKFTLDLYGTAGG